MRKLTTVKQVASEIDETIKSRNCEIFEYDFL